MSTAGIRSGATGVRSVPRSSRCWPHFVPLQGARPVHAERARVRTGGGKGGGQCVRCRATAIPPSKPSTPAWARDALAHHRLTPPFRPSGLDALERKCRPSVAPRAYALRGSQATHCVAQWLASLSRGTVLGPLPREGTDAPDAPAPWRASVQQTRTWTGAQKAEGER